MLARRCAERRRATSVAATLAELRRVVPPDALTWVGHEMRTWWDEVLDQVARTEGRVNFNDALAIAAAHVPAIISFAPDFDGVPGLVRLSTPGSVEAWVQV